MLLEPLRGSTGPVGRSRRRTGSSAAKQAIGLGGLVPAALNGANEKAVELFLQGKISFLQIGEIAQRTVQHFSSAVGSYTLQDVFDCDAEARRFAQQNTSGR